MLFFLLVACSEYEFGDVHRNEAGDPLEDTGWVEEPAEEEEPPAEVAGTAGVTGQICDPAGDGWVVGAEASIVVDADGDGIAEVTATDLTDAQGRFTLDGLPAGPAVIDVQKGSFTTTIDVTLVEGEVQELETPSCLDRDSVLIAVVSGEYDDIGAILDQMTIGYTLYDGIYSHAYIDFLRDPAAMASYDIIFLNCGIGWDWLNYQSEISANLREYVSDGGSVYASDWAYWFIESSHSHMVDFYGDDGTVGAAFVGAPGGLGGRVDDPNMQMLLGSNSASLYFDYNAWAIPTAVDSGAAVLVSGDPQVEESGAVVSGAPLATRLKVGRGQIIYTAFHNEPQLTLDVELILQEIILSL